MVVYMLDTVSADSGKKYIKYFVFIFDKMIF